MTECSSALGFGSCHVESQHIIRNLEKNILERVNEGGEAGAEEACCDVFCDTTKVRGEQAETPPRG